jgi:drug/metabolite transporter (DMT)-like permease
VPTSPRSARRLSYAKALTATVFWGLSFITVRVALESARPAGLVWTRNALGAAVLFALLRARGEPLLPEHADRPRCVLLGLIMGVHLVIQSTAMQLTSAMRAGWIVAFIPTVTAGQLVRGPIGLAGLYLVQRGKRETSPAVARLAAPPRPD